jgi:hypothetical protein
MSNLRYPIRLKFIPSLAYSVTRHRPTTERPLKAPGHNWAKALKKRYLITSLTACRKPAIAFQHNKLNNKLE